MHNLNATAQILNYLKPGTMKNNMNNAEILKMTKTMDEAKDAKQIGGVKDLQTWIATLRQ